MSTEDANEYERRASEELDLAATTTDPAVKVYHLNQAAHFATLSQRAATFERDGSSSPTRSA